MKKCLACKEPLPADAHWRRRYCTNKKCRSRAYRRREKTKVVKQIRALKRGVSTKVPVQSECGGSFVVSCPCGHRLRIEVHHANEEGLTAPAGSTVAAAMTVPTADAPSVAARPEREQANDGQPSLGEEAVPRVSEAPPQEMHPAPAASSVGSPEEGPRSTSEAAETGSHAPAQNGEPPHPTPPLAIGAQKSTSEEPAPAPTALAPASTFRTYELYAEQRGVPLLLDEGLLFDGTRWRLRPGVRLQLGERPEDGFGLAGSPGRWRDAYGAQSPSRFGHGERWAVMYVVERCRQRLGVVVPVEMLRMLLGTEWRQLVSEAG